MFSPIPEILDELRQGRMVILTDDEARENEGDLILPASAVTPESVTFMLSVARGYMCLSLTEADCDRLDLTPQAAVNTTVRGTAFTVSIDGHPRHGFTTGVSAKERARAIRMAIDPKYGPDDFVRPGHINPLRSRDGGTLVRTGQTEGSLDLCRLAGLYPAAAIIEIMRDDGEMARVPDLEKLCKTHQMKMCSVAQIIEHRLARESLIHRIAPAEGTRIRTPEGEFNLIGFDSMVDPQPHLALTLGGIGAFDPARAVIQHDAPVLVRMHRRNLLGDIFGDLDSASDGSTGDTLRAAMREIQKEGRGAVIYLRPESVGDGLRERLQSIRRGSLDTGADLPDLRRPDGLAGNAVPMHLREFGIGGQILRNLGVHKMRLLTNSKTDLPGLEAFGLQIVERVPIT
ncbi:MAG: 3,4-dihydroxy-2-butanone-4-phosphate synthase [Pyrinomonadaceae bacterium]|nr:3,4-dihydroxy-2-butanone-4-phosphate synthase [Phycisphaerales bacterium]